MIPYSKETGMVLAGALIFGIAIIVALVIRAVVTIGRLWPQRED